MASEDASGVVKTDSDIAGEGEKSVPKELFTLEGSVVVNTTVTVMMTTSKFQY